MRLQAGLTQGSLQVKGQAENYFQGNGNLPDGFNWRVMWSKWLINNVSGYCVRMEVGTVTVVTAKAHVAGPQGNAIRWRETGVQWVLEVESVGLANGWKQDMRNGDHHKRRSS